MPETTALATIESISPRDLFKDEVINPLLVRIRSEALEAASTLDISTPENRAALKSLAFKVTKSRTFVEGQRVDLVASEKKRLAAIDKRAKQTKDYLQTLEDEVRKPLTEWEQVDKDRIHDHETALAGIELSGRMANDLRSAQAMRDRIAELTAYPRDWQEFSVKAAGVTALALKQLAEALEKREAYDAEQAELARLRQANIERETKDREERIAREATEKAERAAAEREAQAKRDVEAAEQRARNAEALAKAQEERAEREKQAAVEAEKKRVEDARIAEESAQRVREADREHRKQVNSAILSRLRALGIKHETAAILLDHLVVGNIPNVKITY